MPSRMVRDHAVRTTRLLPPPLGDPPTYMTKTTHLKNSFEHNYWDIGTPACTDHSPKARRPATHSKTTPQSHHQNPRFPISSEHTALKPRKRTGQPLPNRSFYFLGKCKQKNAWESIKDSGFLFQKTFAYLFLFFLKKLDGLFSNIFLFPLSSLPRNAKMTFNSPQ